jgi:hypothetical protein
MFGMTSRNIVSVLRLIGSEHLGFILPRSQTLFKGPVDGRRLWGEQLYAVSGGGSGELIPAV